MYYRKEYKIVRQIRVKEIANNLNAGAINAKLQFVWTYVSTASETLPVEQ